MGWLFNLLNREHDTFSNQNEAVKSLLERAFAERETVPLPTLKNLRYDGKNTIASHTKIISNLREHYRKQGKDIICHEKHIIRGSRMVENHTAYELVDWVRPVTKLITTVYA